MTLHRLFNFRFPCVLTVVLLAFGTALSGLADTYYVSPTGDDDAPGTQTLPWRSIQKAAESLVPGDTAIVLSGTYREQVFVECSGTRENPVTLQAKGKVVVSAKGQKSNNVFYIENKSHLRIIGFEICDLQTKDGSGIRYEGTGSGLEFRDNHIHDMHGKNATGIVVYGTDQKVPVTGLVIAGNRIHDCDAAPSEAIAVNGNVDGFLIENNHVHDVDGIGIDMIGGEDGIASKDKVARNGICRGNRVERARSSYEGGYGAGIYVDGGRDIVIERNFITACDLGIEIGAENKGLLVSGVIVRNNIVLDNDKAGFAIGGYDKKVGRVEGCRIEHNHFLTNTHHAKAETEIWVQVASGNEFRNNLIVGTASRPLLYADNGAGNHFDGNLWYAPGEFPERFVWKGKASSDWKSFRLATELEPSGQWADPFLMEDGQHLKADSPARDAGLDLPGGSSEADFFGNARRIGPSPDIGAVELPAATP